MEMFYCLHICLHNLIWSHVELFSKTLIFHFKVFLMTKKSSDKLLRDSLVSF